MIGISLLTLVPGVVGGSETYARELTRALHRVGELDYRVFAPTIAPDAGDGLPTRAVAAYRASRTIPGRIRAMALAAARPGRVRRELELGRLDAIHFPLSVMLPPVERPPAVTTILDVQHEFHPDFFSRLELTYRRAVYGFSARRSRLVIAISKHARETLVERLALDARRVRVIHLGVDHATFRPGAEARDRFLLYPANRWPHKNHERLFAAFRILRQSHPELTLVLTGSGHEAHSVPVGVDLRGRVSKQELARLYRTAAALVFPSLYEGFGQPPLEAMACGCPVAVSRIPPLQEVCGAAARYFDPTSAEDIATVLDELLARPAEDLVRAGLERAAAFTWDECARRHEDVYREVAGASS